MCKSPIGAPPPIGYIIAKIIIFWTAKIDNMLCFVWLHQVTYHLYYKHVHVSYV